MSKSGVCGFDLEKFILNYRKSEIRISLTSISPEVPKNKPGG